MGMISKKKVNSNFFKTWTPKMSYVLGYTVADGCIIKRKGRDRSYTFNITSKDRDHLAKIKRVLGSDYTISIKANSQKLPYFQIQISNYEICRDLINLGIIPRKTYNLNPVKTPKKYFSNFVRGFFDGDGTVYIYKVNRVWQIKSGFVSSTLSFLEEFNKKLCKELNIPCKAIHKSFSKGATRYLYSICFYINDSEKLAEFMYGNNSSLFLTRKKKIFDRWKSINRRHYIKQNYPSKIGWNLGSNKLQQNQLRPVKA